ncbi:MAG TPA: hypothetical protein VEZ42_17650, partial [Pseudonocardia sp.]|nr:hypothetical protein [Pseudonocardia sp.]
YAPRHSVEPARAPRRWSWLVAGVVAGVLLGLGVAALVSSGVGAGARGSAVENAALTRLGTWGQRVSTPNGITIEVGAPVAYEPSPSAAGHEQDRAVLITATLVNGSDEPFVLNTFAVGPTAVHGGRPASRIFDGADRLPAVPVAPVPPGGSVTFRTAFSIGAGRGELVLEFAADPSAEPAVVSGPA